ncbi:MAG: DUF1799 domain-containing protein [Alphaproteobacteria bacterium]|nr:DUF1799 domain-containing protein [Alphaproteobacteria bacterium]
MKGPNSISDEELEDFKRFGADEEFLEKQKSKQPETFIICPENWEALQLFLSCSTQWRIGFDGSVQGLDYQGVYSALLLMGKQPNQDLFEKIRIMETEAIKTWQKA